MPKVCPVCGTVYPDANVFCPGDGTTLHVVDLEGGLIGSVVADRYLVTELLGEGGMGKVYLARHVRLPQQAAIKVLRADMVTDAAAVARFNREASNASRIDDEHVARVYDFGEASGGTVYLAMEYVPGRTLKDLIARQGALEPRRAAALVEQIAKGLDAAHRLKIIHRDLKPDNVLVVEGPDGTDRVKVVDFGIAKAFGAGEGNLTKTGFVVGTPEFMSPEQLVGGALDARSDVYALALVAFQLLTASLPFGGDTPEQAMTARLMSAPRQLADVTGRQWPPALQAAFDAALARDVSKRPESAGAFARLLSAAIKEWVPGTGAVPVASTAPKGPEAAPARRGLRWPVIAGAVVVLATGAGLAYRFAFAPGATGSPDGGSPSPGLVGSPGATDSTAGAAATGNDSLAKAAAPRVVAATPARNTPPPTRPPADSGRAGAPDPRRGADSAAPRPAPAAPAPAAVDAGAAGALDSLIRVLGQLRGDKGAAVRIAGELNALASRLSGGGRTRAYIGVIRANISAGETDGACAAVQKARASAQSPAQLEEVRRLAEGLGCG